MLIALGHSAHSGKDTLASFLVKHHGFTRLAFADPIRSLTYDLRPDVAALVDQVGWDRAKRTDPDVRQALIDVGELLRRHLGQSSIVRSLEHPALSVDRVVITDLRFVHELEAVRSWGGVVVKVTRPGHAPRADSADQALAGWDDWDYVVDNDGDLDQLRSKGDNLVRLVRARQARPR